MIGTMRKRSLSIAVISYTLALLYAVSFVYYLSSVATSVVYHYAIAVSLMCLVLFFGAVGLSFGKSWGRTILIFGNIAFFAVGIWMITLFPEVIELQSFDQNTFFNSLFLGTICLAAVICAYLAQHKVKLLLNPDMKYMRKSVLVIDDDEGILTTMKKILLPVGYSVLTASSGERGLQIAQTQKPDLIVLDVILPGLKGREVCRRLKDDAATKDIPVIFLTAKDSPDDIKAEMDLGAIAHVTKPLHARLMVAKVKEILG
ncbi:MAG TPA: response regulator [Candidatus Omnitrophota bacterium]|nr:response regulator [Candidatus Omnitrophota bacterium]HSA30417.1 response regulator [Candidatus Omnitrophota bacterium]